MGGAANIPKHLQGDQLHWIHAYRPAETLRKPAGNRMLMPDHRNEFQSNRIFMCASPRIGENEYAAYPGDHQNHPKECSGPATLCPTGVVPRPRQCIPRVAVPAHPAAIELTSRSMEAMWTGLQSHVW